jgi:zinc and cadmium transporter
MEGSALMTTVLIFGFALAGSVGALSLAAAFLVLPAEIRSTILPALIAYATGSLIGAAFLGLLPEAIGRAPAQDVLATALAGIFAFFLLEKLLIWRHHHQVGAHHHHASDEDHEHLGAAVGPLLLLGDGVHNFADGVVISVTFDVSIELGVAASVAIVVHEVAQEVGDFAILLDAGYRPAKAFAWNTVSGLTTLLGAALAYAFADRIGAATPYVMAVAASTFLYIGMADLIPALHRHVGHVATLSQLVLMGAGVGTIVLIHSVA